MVLVPIEDGCFCLDTSRGFLVLLWNIAVAPPFVAKRVLFFIFYAVEMSRVQVIQGKAFWLIKKKKWRGKEKAESTSVTKTSSKLFFNANQMKCSIPRLLTKPF